MSDSSDAAFIFRFTDFQFVEKGGLAQRAELRLLGRITRGGVAWKMPIMFPTARGPARGFVGQFMDSMDGWLGLPFYTELTLDTTPDEFCLCLVGFPRNISPVCPGTAYWAPLPTPRLNALGANVQDT